MKRLIVALCVAAVSVLILAAGPRQNQRQGLEFKTDTRKIRVVPIAEGLDSPWSMVFLRGGDILLTERPGRPAQASAGQPSARSVRSGRVSPFARGRAG